MLFPGGSIGEKIARSFSQNGYRILLIAPDRRMAEHMKESGVKNVQSFTLALEEEFWSSLASGAVNDILSAPVVIYCAEKDFLKLNSTGFHDEWRIDLDSDSQKKLSFVDQLLSRRISGPGLWINLVLGTSTHQDADADYCKSRYGMIGFGKILELNPRFSDMKILNICLSFFRHHKNGQRANYCSHCTTLELREALTTLGDENDLVRYLLQQSNELMGA